MAQCSVTVLDLIELMKSWKSIFQEIPVLHNLCVLNTTLKMPLVVFLFFVFAYLGFVLFFFFCFWLFVFCFVLLFYEIVKEFLTTIN